MRVVLVWVARAGEWIDVGPGRQRLSGEQKVELETISRTLQCLLAEEGFTDEPVGGSPPQRDGVDNPQVGQIVEGFCVARPDPTVATFAESARNGNGSVWCVKWLRGVVALRGAMALSAARNSEAIRSVDHALREYPWRTLARPFTAPGVLT